MIIRINLLPASIADRILRHVILLHLYRRSLWSKARTDRFGSLLLNHPLGNHHTSLMLYRPGQLSAGEPIFQAKQGALKKTPRQRCTDRGKNKVRRNLTVTLT